MKKIIKWIVSVATSLISSKASVSQPEPVSLNRQLFNEIRAQESEALSTPSTAEIVRVKKSFRAPPLPLFIAHHANPKKILVESKRGELLVFKVKRLAAGIIAGDEVQLRRLHHPGVTLRMPTNKFLAARRLAV